MINSPAFLKKDLAQIQKDISEMEPSKAVNEVVEFMKAIISYQEETWEELNSQGEALDELTGDESEYLSLETAATIYQAFEHCKLMMSMFANLIHPESQLAEHIDDMTRQRGMQVVEACAQTILLAEKELADLTSYDDDEEENEDDDDGDTDPGDREDDDNDDEEEEEDDGLEEVAAGSDDTDLG